MKKTVVFLFITFITSLLISNEINNYPLEVMKVFPNGSERNELTVKGHNDISYPIGPPCFSFDEKGYLYIIDYIPNERIIIYDEKFKFINETKGDFYTSEKLEIDRQGNYICYFTKGFIKFKSNVNIIFSIDFNNSSYVLKVDIKKSIITDNIVLIQLNDKSYISIPDPTSDYKENLKKVLNQEETIEYVNKKLKQKGVPKNERISMKDGLIFKGDKLLTRDFKTYYKYMTEKQNREGLQRPKKTNTNLDVSNYSGLGYLGEDNDENTYWKDYGAIIVFNKNCYIIDYMGFDNTMFDYDPENGMGCVFPVIHPNGDVYFLGYDFTESKLYRIKRRWFSPAVITEKEIKLKDIPSLSAKETGEPLEEKTEVEVIERNDDKIKVTDKENYWYKVKAGTIEGWIFGGYIEFVE